MLHQNEFEKQIRDQQMIVNPQNSVELAIALQNPHSPAFKMLMNMIIEGATIGAIIEKLIQRFLMEQVKEEKRRDEERKEERAKYETAQQEAMVYAKHQLQKSQSTTLTESAMTSLLSDKTLQELIEEKAKFTVTVDKILENIQSLRTAQAENNMQIAQLQTAARKHQGEIIEAVIPMMVGVDGKPLSEEERNMAREILSEPVSGKQRTLIMDSYGKNAAPDEDFMVQFKHTLNFMKYYRILAESNPELASHYGIPTITMRLNRAHESVLDELSKRMADIKNRKKAARFLKEETSLYQDNRHIDAQIKEQETLAALEKEKVAMANALIKYLIKNGTGHNESKDYTPKF